MLRVEAALVEQTCLQKPQAPQEDADGTMQEKQSTNFLNMFYVREQLYKLYEHSITL